MKTSFGEFKIMTLRETPATYMADNPEAIVGYHRSVIQADPTFRPEQEQLHVILQNTRRRIIGHTLVGLGTVDQVLVHPRDVLRPAIIASASFIVLVHNHPSGDSSPSEADVKVTRELIRAGQLMKVELSDHVVVGTGPDIQGRGWTSLRELGYWGIA